jgi:predicted ATPase
MLLEHIAISGLLSFGTNGIDLPLRRLNVLIGPNGSGKSNLIEAISLLQAAPRHLALPIQNGGGISDWLWKGEERVAATLTVEVDGGFLYEGFVHELTFSSDFLDRQFCMQREAITERQPGTHGEKIESYVFQAHKQAELQTGKKRIKIDTRALDSEHSVLSQRKGPEQYLLFTSLGEQYDRIRIYREWSFGCNTAPRLPQKADQRNDFLAEDCSNLGLVLNRLRQTPTAKNRILEMLGHLYPEFSDFDVSIEGNTVQVFFTEGKFTVPATRLSDGTLRYLCLLAVLCHPEPPPLVCIEEPELGLHPDVMAKLAELMKEASQRTQLIVTTHSEALIDALSDSPEDVIVCEKHDGETTMNRLDGDALKEWLERYSLGELWTRGEIGGNRW